MEPEFAIWGQRSAILMHLGQKCAECRRLRKLPTHGNELSQIEVRKRCRCESSASDRPRNMRRYNGVKRFDALELAFQLTVANVAVC